MSHPSSQTQLNPALGVIVVGGGRGSRLGGIDKAALRNRQGQSLLQVQLETLQRALAPTKTEVVVVGPARLEVPVGVARVQEEPPLAGPAAAVAAGWRYLEERGITQVGIIPGDALQAGRALAALRQAGAPARAFAGGFAQHLVLYLHAEHLRQICAAPVENLSMRRFLTGLELRDFSVEESWVADIDTVADLGEWSLPCR